MNRKDPLVEMAIIYVCRFQLYYGTIILKMTLPREKGFGAPE